jgi:hypothetical protein
MLEHTALVQMGFGSLAPGMEGVFIRGCLCCGKGVSRPGVGAMKTHLKEREAVLFCFLDFAVIEPVAGLADVSAEGLQNRIGLWKETNLRLGLGRERRSNSREISAIKRDAISRTTR